MPWSSAAASSATLPELPRPFANGAVRATGRASRRSGVGGLAADLSPRLLAGRRHLHRDRGGLQRPPDHARAQGARPASAPCSTWRVSLAFTAGGLLLCYLLLARAPVPGKTMNAVLVERIAGRAAASAPAFVVLTLFSEAALLVVAAQAGFLDGPRVLANMAVDSWVPHRFAALSERLTTQNGILLMGGAALAALLYTGGRRRPPGRDVLHQRVPHLLALHVRHAPLLAPAPGAAGRMADAAWRSSPRASRSASRSWSSPYIEKFPRAAGSPWSITGLLIAPLLRDPAPLSPCGGEDVDQLYRELGDLPVARGPARPQAVTLDPQQADRGRPGRRLTGAWAFTRCSTSSAPFPGTTRIWSSSRSASWTPASSRASTRSRTSGSAPKRCSRVRGPRRPARRAGAARDGARHRRRGRGREALPGGRPGVPPATFFTGR